YWYNPPDWWKFQEFSERINFEILRRFKEEGIEFAFPTQTLFMAGDPKRPLVTRTIPDSAGTDPAHRSP
ncbi:MAG: mechanosensitive ion channel family protein, partial [Kiritimatiellia bacterium]|nr:mechanosensitive ion channel family protein [Kiritimatiellia bacterium]